jgi:hypothetical protein
MNQVVPPNALYVDNISNAPQQDNLVSRISSSNIATSILSPFKVIWKCHLLLVSYLALLLTSMFWICTEIEKFVVANLVSLGSDLGIASDILNNLTLGASIIIWISCLPVVLVAVSLPTEDLWLYKKMSLFRVLKQTPANIFVTFQTLVIGLRSVFYYLIPLFATIAGYAYAAKKGYFPQIPPVLHLLAVIIFLSVLWKTIPILLAPIVAICGQYTTMGALSAAPSIVHKSWFNLTMIFLLGVGITVPAIYAVQQLHLPTEQQVLAYAATISGCLWYTFSAATHELMTATGRVLFEDRI